MHTVKMMANLLFDIMLLIDCREWAARTLYIHDNTHTNIVLILKQETQLKKRHSIISQ